MRRVLTVHFVPCTLFVACAYALIRSGSFLGRAHWHTVLPTDASGIFGALLLVGAGAAVLGILLYPFQVRAVRVLEGYWDRWPATAGLAGVLMEVQRRRRQALSERADAAVRGGTNARRVAADAYRRMASGAPEDVLLPTALGNALRAGELSAGERYGLTTLSSWPRILMQTSDRLSEALRSARTALDASVNLCWSLLASGVLAAVALYDEPTVRWAPLAAFLLASVAYKGAVTAAQAYAGLMHVVYDLHRFDLLDALHHPLPDAEEEAETFWRVSQLLEGRPDPGLPYNHARSSAPDHTDGSADA
ncbi:hypothetical protein M2156_003257 [Streptomyces sp. SAI-149]|nr:hypothetical protein [Streptomyces sp. SAI-119]MDH6497038.1 hypothetical protein [Streptomyces sp. SAI-149]